MKTTLSIICLFAASMALAQDCCQKKGEVKHSQSSYASGKSCGDKKMSANEEFLMEAEKMAMAAEGKSMCCKSTVVKPVAKGAEGCCNAPGEPQKFKVFVAGKGYRFFGCEGSAGAGRKELLAKGERVGSVQKVSGKAARA